MSAEVIPEVAGATLNAYNSSFEAPKLRPDPVTVPRVAVGEPPELQSTVMTVPAGIDLKIQLVETGSDKVLGEAEVVGSPGNAFAGAAWDTGNRIQEAYAKAGKSFAKWLPKKGMK